ncbi:MAG: DUF6526 family protein [Bryobacteraceae bacterium]
METQNYASHARLVTGYHKILLPVLLLTLIGAGVNLYESLHDHQRLYSASLILVLVVSAIAIALYARIFALKAQDRAIRAEENLRHLALTGKLLDARLSMSQIVGLRFAPDAEFPELAARAASESMTLDAIKRAVKNWKPDEDRV